MFDEARARFEESLAISRRLHGEGKAEVASVMSNFALILAKQGCLEEALSTQASFSTLNTKH